MTHRNFVNKQFILYLSFYVSYRFFGLQIFRWSTGTPYKSPNPGSSKCQGTKTQKNVIDIVGRNIVYINVSADGQREEASQATTMNVMAKRTLRIRIQ